MSETRIDLMLARRREARERFEENPHSGVYLAIAGVSTDARSLAIGDHFELERLEYPVMFGAHESTLRLSPTHQLAFSSDGASFEDSWLIDTFWTVCALLRIRCGGQFVAPEFSSVSWNVADGVPVGEARRSWIVPGQRPNWWTTGVHIGDADVAWVGEKLLTTMELRADEQFHYSLECYFGSFDELDPRMAASKAWAGIEGLMGISSELRFRLSMFIAALLEPPGDSRFSLYKRVVKLYDKRSKIVHGAAVPREAVLANVADAQDVLARLLTETIGRGSVWTTTQVERHLLAPLDLK